MYDIYIYDIYVFSKNHKFKKKKTWQKATSQKFPPLDRSLTNSHGSWHCPFLDLHSTSAIGRQTLPEVDVDMANAPGTYCKSLFLIFQKAGKCQKTRWRMENETRSFLRFACIYYIITYTVFLFEEGRKFSMRIPLQVARFTSQCPFLQKEGGDFSRNILDSQQKTRGQQHPNILQTAWVFAKSSPKIEVDSEILSCER